MADILDEIKFDQSEEKKIRLLKSLLPFIIFVAVMLAGSLLIYNWQQDKAKLARTRISDILNETNDKDGNSSAFDFNILNDVIKNNDKKISELAHLKQVGIKIASKEEDEAKKLLEEIIPNKKYDIVTVAFARIIWLGIMIDKDNITDQEKNQLDDYLRYFDNEKKPFYGLANIYKALWLIKSNQTNLAEDSLKRLIAIKSISPNISELAEVILSNLSNK